MQINSINPGVVPFRLDPKALSPGQQEEQKIMRQYLALTACFAVTAVASGFIFTATPLAMAGAIALSTAGFVKYAITTAEKYKDYNQNSQKRTHAIETLNTNFNLTYLNKVGNEAIITIDEEYAFLEYYNYLSKPGEIVSDDKQWAAKQYILYRRFEKADYTPTDFLIQPS